MSISQIVKNNAGQKKYALYGSNLYNRVLSMPVVNLVANQTDVTLTSFLYDGSNLTGPLNQVLSNFNFTSGALGSITVKIQNVAKNTTFYTATFNASVVNPIALNFVSALPTGRQVLLITYSTDSAYNLVGGNVNGMNLYF